MKSVLKSEKGVSLISLGVAIIIMMIITSMLIYSTKDTMQVSKLNKMYDDISNLTDKVSAYYAQYGDIPIKNKITEIPKGIESLMGANDQEGEFYVLDLKSIDGLTLNYGQDYKEIQESNSNYDISEKNDVYIINNRSHNIFYLKGITVDQKNYYTNYTEGEKDANKVNLRYVDGIKIPNGYYYIGKNNEDKVVISNSINDVIDSKNQNEYQYEWNTALPDDGIDESYSLNGNTYTEELKEKLNESFNQNKGYFQNLVDKKKVLFIEVEDTWSPVYEQEGIYTDEDGYTAYIPAGFCVSTRKSMSKIKKGLVIKNNTTSNQYVWIEVPKNITENSVTAQQIEEALKEYVSDYRNENYEDVWYDGCYIDENSNSKDAYNELKNKMLESIKLNGGFYIGRYEVGTNEVGTNENIQPGQNIQKKTIKYAQSVARSIDVDENYNSSLMFGIQWDLVCKFIAKNANLTTKQIIEDSSIWGNYEDKTNTGEKEILNIYDIADNDAELTLEKSNDNAGPVVVRGGDSTNKNVANRTSTGKTNDNPNNINAFRITLFK